MVTPQRARDAVEEGTRRFRITGSKDMIFWMQSTGGSIRLMQSRAEEALPMFEEAAEIAAAWDEWRMGPRAIGNLATANHFAGNHETAWKLIDKALSDEKVASPRFRADALAMAGDLALVEGDLDGARSYLEDSLALSEQRPDRWPQPMLSLALVAELEGDLERAFELAESYVELNKNSRFSLPPALTALGRVEAKLGRYAEAAEHLGSAIKSAITDNTRPVLATAAEAAAVLKEKQGNPKDAARLLGAAHSLRQQSEMPPYYTYRPLHEIIVRTVRTAAGESFKEGFNEGREMRPEDIQGLLLGADDSGK